MKPSSEPWALSLSTFEAFEAGARASGFDEAIVREWAADTVLESHSHPFDAEAVVVAGEMWLGDAAGEHHLEIGDTFALPAGGLHSERYGTAGATYWVARRQR